MEIVITIPEELASKARASGLSAESYVQRLLDRFLAASAERERSREALRSDLAADWEQYQSTGLHLDNGEVDAWLAQREEGHFEDPPALHV
jgi:hypothetical protein